MDEGKTLATTGDDKSIRIWDIPSETCTHEIPDAHTDYIRSLALLAPTVLLSGSYDQTIKVWDLSTVRSVYAFFNILSLV